MTYQSGNTFSGQWDDNLKNGVGIMNWQNQVYNGMWKDNKPNGYG